MWVSHCRSAPGVLAAVQKAIAKHKAKKVTIAGHSLGTSPSDPFLLVVFHRPLWNVAPSGWLRDHYQTFGHRPPPSLGTRSKRAGYGTRQAGL